MIELERRLQDRFPHWFRGRRARLARPLVRGLQRWSRIDALDGFLARNGDARGLALARRALAFLGVSPVVTGGLQHVPPRGACLIVANHPSGALDALALLDAVGTVRPDVRIVANDLLAALDGLRDLFLPVRILGGRPDATSLRAIDRALAAGQCVVMFPAGAVARLGPRGVRDGRWSDAFIRFARRHRAPVVPVRIDARNSALFYGASLLFRPAGTALLAREMFARRSQPLRLAFGAATDACEPADRRGAADAVRRQLERLDTRAPGDTVQAGPAPLAAPADPAQVGADIEALELLGRTLDGKQIRVGRPGIDSPLMQEIGRLRELTFRAVGEGTGQARDIDRFDADYDQIVLWDADAACIAGGYRVAHCARLIGEQGLAGLYTASLFRYAPGMLPRLASGLELGRSFVVPDYWGSRSLDYLWQGVGAYVARRPWVRYLYGPVSISATLPSAAREQVVAFYAAWHGGRDEVSARRPFKPTVDATPDASAGDADTAFRGLRDRLALLGAQVPMLYKQYTDLCEPGGARFLAFGTDPDFSDVIDGLVEVDLTRLRPRKRDRYLGQPAQQPACELAA